MVGNKLNKILTSIIIPTFKGEEVIESLVNQLILIFKNVKYEIIIINDCSPDNTHEICINLNKKFPKLITYLKLGKNSGEHNAVMAGLKFATGNYIIILDDDSQNPPEQALKILNYTKSNSFDVVYTYYDKRKYNYFRNFISKINDWSANIFLGKPKGLYLSSFKCLQKKIVDKIIEYNGPYPYIDGLILGATSNIGSIKTEHSRRKTGRSSYSLIKLFKLYYNMVTNFSILPIHFITILGILISLISGFYAFFNIIQKLIEPNYPIGYASIITAIIFFAGIQLVFLGIIGEYIGKILSNVNNQPQFFIDYIKKRNE